MHTHSANTNNYSQFFSLFSKLQQIGYPQEREEIVYCYTEGRTTSLKELTPDEYKALIAFLNETLKHQTKVVGEKENRQKRKIIALFCQMGYVTDQRADMPRINAWCISHGHLKKTLNYYHGKDLIKLLNQADKVYQSFITSL